MKRLLNQAIAFAMVLLSFYSCEKTAIDEESIVGNELKSANLKTTYIVVINNADLNSELVLTSDYDLKKSKVRDLSEKILKRAEISDAEVEYVYGAALKGFSIKIPPGQLKKLQSDPDVVLMEEDKIISLTGKGGKPGKPIDPIPPTPVAQNTPWGVTRVGGPVTYTGSNVAWIIDTGVDFTHPDLNVDISRSKNFVSTATTANDDNGHGTHVAGTIAAKNNTIGVVGIAAGAYVVPVKVLNSSGSGTTSGVIAGIDYVASMAKSGDVANMSLGGGASSTLDAAVLNASKVCAFAIAAGNNGADANNYSPGRINGANIYTVSAMEQGDIWASYSNFGNPPVDFCAPGTNIYSCYKGGIYATMSGTSMATPHVAGLLLLGTINANGYVSIDPDGIADPIAHR